MTQLKRPRVDISSATLSELLNNTLDPGYRSAATRDRRKHWWDGPLVWLSCLAVGLLLVMAYQQTHLAAPARDAARQDLISRIKAAQSTANRLDAQAKQLAEQVGALRDAQLPADDAALRAAEVAAGAVAVSGPGMQVVIGEPTSTPSSDSGRPGSTPQSQVAVIHDTDVRAVVNELWADGAEAIAVNGLRLTPDSVIRFAGESILLDFSPLTSPYTISAIGDANGLQVGFAQSSIARRLKTLVAVAGISFRFGGKTKLQLPSVTVGEPHYASIGPASTAPSPSAGGPSSSPSPTTTESR
ncbi:MAG TPA: DUF881 domain-containing protein [Jatrophihabitans sp.]|nr:DUF881 domain-containing protein [Jatrophihabitans sp.]